MTTYTLDEVIAALEVARTAIADAGEAIIFGELEDVPPNNNPDGIATDYLSNAEELVRHVHDGFTNHRLRENVTRDE